MTRVLPVDPHHPQPDRIAQAAALLQAGELVAFPTETVYGLGANALDATAVSKIFAAKERPAYDPLIVHLHEADALPRVVRAVPALAWRLAERFWPGPLTLILPRAAAVPTAVTAGLETVAVRVPAHPVALALLRAAALPVAAPSANRFGYTSPTTAAHVLADLEGRIPLVLDGGPTQIGVESTVLDLTADQPTILRPGGVTREALEAVLGPVRLARQPAAEETAVPSPGLLPRHYAPHAHLVLFAGPPLAVRNAMQRRLEAALRAGQRVGLLLTEADRPLFAPWAGRARLEILGPAEDPAAFGQALYAALRRLDAAETEIVLAHTLPPRGLGLAINNRLHKAAAEVVRLED